MRATRLPVAVLVIGFLAGPALAEEIIYFTNGTTMPIQAHSVVGEMIHVDLGERSYMAFPLKMVERVTRAGQEVQLTRSTAKRNRMAMDHAAQAGAVQAESTSVNPEKETLEERISRYTREARSGAIQQRTLTPEERRSISADAVTSVDLDGAGSYGGRQQFAGAQPNLSGRRLSYLKPSASMRKTVGGVHIGMKAAPTKSRVELVGLQRVHEAPTQNDSGSRASGGNSDN